MAIKNVLYTNIEQREEGRKQKIKEWEKRTGAGWPDNNILWAYTKI
jgi:hypothetical protein